MPLPPPPAPPFLPSQAKEKELRDTNILREADRRRVEGVRAQVETQLEEKEKEMAAERAETEVKRQEFLGMLDELEDEIKSLEAERDDLKRQLGSRSSRKLGSRIMSSTGDASSADLRAARLEVDLLQQALSFSRAELAKARATVLRESMAALTPLAAVRDVPVALKESSRVLKDANTLTKDLLLRGATAQVVDVATPAEPSTQRKSGAAQLADATAALVEARQKATSLRQEMRQLLARGTGRPDTHFGDHAVDAYVKLTEQRTKPQLAGRITMPAPINARSTSIYLSGTELKQLHAALL